MNLERLGPALAAIAVLSFGCTAGYPEPEGLDAEAAKSAEAPTEPAQDPAGPELVPAPDEPPPPLPPSPESDDDDDALWQPKPPALAPEDWPQLELNNDGFAGPCDFGVVSRGLPAINRGTEQVVNLEFERDQGPSDYDESRVVLVWRDFDDQVLRSEEVYDALNLAPGDYGDAPRVYCAKARRALAARLPVLNAHLEAEPLAPMVALPVQLAALRELPQAPLPSPGAERPVELIYNGGELITRVRGLKVLARTPHPSWQGPVESLDAYNPNIVAVYGAREAGIAVVARSYETASCMSNTQVYFGVTRLPEAAFAEIERRSQLVLEPIEGAY